MSFADICEKMGRVLTPPRCICNIFVHQLHAWRLHTSFTNLHIHTYLSNILYLQIFRYHEVTINRSDCDHYDRRKPFKEIQRTLEWCHNERNGFWNHRRFECLRNRLFRRRSKKTSKLRLTGLCGASNGEMCPFDDIIMMFDKYFQNTPSPKRLWVLASMKIPI